MKRRAFIAGLGMAAAWPLAARAQQRPALPVVGFLRVTSHAESLHLEAAFLQGLKDAGFVEGQNVTIEYRWADNEPDRLPALVADLLGRHASVIIGHSSAVVAAKAATTTVAIVFVVGNDPVRTGLVTSLNRPGGNVTGVTFSSVDVITKRLGQLHDLIPGAELIGVLVDPNLPEHELEISDAEAAAKAIGQRVLALTAASPDDFIPAFEKLTRAGAGALVVGGSAFLNSQRHRLAVLCARHALPASFSNREFVLAGGLLSYGPSQTDAYRRAGVYAGRILKGEKPGDLPVDQPTKFELVINLGTAKMLGVPIPNAMQSIADELIE
jgi:putative ABC transport system substrate-binding protein